MGEAHFLWDPNRTNSTKTPTGLGVPIHGLLDKTYKAFAGTSNMSTLGPDGISYKTHKMANKTALGSAIMLQVATSLSTGFVPEMATIQSSVYPQTQQDHT